MAYLIGAAAITLLASLGLHRFAARTAAPAHGPDSPRNSGTTVVLGTVLAPGVVAVFAFCAGLAKLCLLDNACGDRAVVPDILLVAPFGFSDTIFFILYAALTAPLLHGAGPAQRRCTCLWWSGFAAICLATAAFWVWIGATDPRIFREVGAVVLLVTNAIIGTPIAVVAGLMGMVAGHILCPRGTGNAHPSSPT